MAVLTPFTLLAALLLAVLSTVGAVETRVYFKLGDSRVLTPARVSGAITSVSWKHNGDVVAEWVEPTLPLDFFGVLIGRAELNKTTGVLTMTNMVKDNEGLYSVEINDMLQEDTFRARLLSAVPDPTVDVKPLTCSATSRTCTLVCEGNIAGAEPVTYFWKLGDGDWEPGQQEREITNEGEGARPTTCSCRMENPVSVKDSPIKENPFSIPPTPPSPPVGVIVGVIVAIFVPAAAALVGIYIFRKHRLVSSFLTRVGIIPAIAPETNGGTAHGEANSLADPAAEELVGMNSHK